MGEPTKVRTAGKRWKPWCEPCKARGVHADQTQTVFDPQLKRDLWLCDACAAEREQTIKETN